MADLRSIEILVFGATGYTGQYVVNELAKLAKEYGSLTWGIAGRNKDKLQGVLRKTSEKTGEDWSNVPLVIADVKDPESLKAMTSRTKVLVNCCGPYRFLGEAVVKACIESGTHHLDISTEPQYMELMQLKYNKAAEEKGVYVISACGFASIPTDLGTVYLQKNFEGGMNSAEIFLRIGTIPSEKKIKRGALAHFGTWESVVYWFAHWYELWRIRSKLNKQKLPALRPKLIQWPFILNNEIVRGPWCLTFWSVDKSVIERSQRHFFEKSEQRPAQINTYFVVSNFLIVIGLFILGLVFLLMSQCCLGRKLLLKYPKVFTCGFVSHEGPTEEAEEHTSATFTFRGKGWSEKDMASSCPPDKTVITNVAFKSPGYGFTALSLILCSIMTLKESGNMPGRGGVLPPAAAFRKTSLIEQLMQHDVKFEVTSSEVVPVKRSCCLSVCV
nr:PREDICTED: saccharopine dehydrogenase-like oxidoreductase [Bemisia tabaci]